MVSLWRWLTCRVRKSPNTWAIAGGVYLIVLPLIFASSVALAQGHCANQNALVRLALSLWETVIGSYWFWFAYTAAVAIGTGMIHVGMTRAFQPRE
jgi:hypothetical protein